jgi:hypothetical protein
VRLLEEAGEAYQKVSKEAGLKRSDQKSDKVETMYRKEWMRDEAILKYGLRGRNAEKSKNSSLFVEHVLPNLIIPSCIYNIDPASHKTFAQLMLLMTRREYAQALLFPCLCTSSLAFLGSPIPFLIEESGSASAHATASATAVAKTASANAPQTAPTARSKQLAGASQTLCLWHSRVMGKGPVTFSCFSGVMSPPRSKGTSTVKLLGLS